jgi:uncharacterized membrane protein (DUF485 family)
MKATSLIQVHIQHEMTIAGLPLRLLLVAVVTGCSFLIIPLIARSIAIAIPCGVIGILCSWLYLTRRHRANPFFDRQLLLAPRFWISRKGNHCVLSTGGKRQ